MDSPTAVADRGSAICVVGAGAAGLAAVKNLREHGFDVDCYEREAGVGGLWNWRHERSPVTAATHLISSRPMTEYPDFPMPDHWPDFPHHRQVRSYLESYADHFGLRRDVWFGTEVAAVRPTPDLRWDVTTAAGRTARYAGLVVANGHHWHPVRPAYPGQDTFTGRLLHAAECKEPGTLRGQRVLVVGGGNSAADLVVALAGQARECWLSLRRGYWIFPNYLGGRPLDQATARLRGVRLPARWRAAAVRWLLRRTVGDPTRFGLPRPDHPPTACHPTVNSALPLALGRGDVVAVPDIDHFADRAVILADGRRIDPDVVVFATGYAARYDFLPPGLLDGPLGLHAFPAEHPTLAVAGLPQTTGTLLPLLHWQSMLAARWLHLWFADPARAAAVRPRLHAAAGFAAPALATPRHAAEVDPHRYLRALDRLLTDTEPAR